MLRMACVAFHVCVVCRAFLHTACWLAGWHLAWRVLFVRCTAAHTLRFWLLWQAVLREQTFYGRKRRRRARRGGDDGVTAGREHVRPGAARMLRATTAGVLLRGAQSRAGVWGFSYVQRLPTCHHPHCHCASALFPTLVLPSATTLIPTDVLRRKEGGAVMTLPSRALSPPARSATSCRLLPSRVPSAMRAYFLHSKPSAPYSGDGDVVRGHKGVAARLARHGGT